MKTTTRRIALLTGASLTAIGLSAPAFAQAGPPTQAASYDGTGISHVVTSPPADLTDTLVICDLAPETPTSPCVYGEEAVGAGVQSAYVGAGSGAIVQDLDATGAAFGEIINNGDARIEAWAEATGATADASAYIETAIYQTIEAGEDATAAFTNNATLLIDAVAIASGDVAEADADVDVGLEQVAISTGAGDANAIILNDGAFTVQAYAEAMGTLDADASASAEGIYQRASAAGDMAMVDLTNNGEINVFATAYAEALEVGGDADASAYASGIEQSATGATAEAMLLNTATIDVAAFASANADDFATAYAYARSGVDQDLYGTQAAGTVSNEGVISLAATALANGNDAYASASASSGIDQYASVAAGGTGILAAVNAGTVELVANATATGVTDAGASAEAADGIVQYAYLGAGGTANLSILNEGTVSLLATANAAADDAEADAGAGWAMAQSAYGVGGIANLTMTNDGTVTASANAVAIANDEALLGVASASASASGLFQEAGTGLETGNLVLTNGGTLNVAANATATAPVNAYAQADAIGVRQELNAATANTGAFTNSGEINVSALALTMAGEADDLDGFGDSAYASANGYIATGATATLTAVNSGALAVNATAVAAEYADAFAGGMRVLGLDGDVSISNAGSLTVVADASGGTSSQAIAIGISRAFGAGNTTLTNSGTLAVDAITHNGAEATAAGIIAFTTGVPAEGEVTTITNDGGDIIVRESIDGGTTWRRGVAITSSPLGFASSTPTVVNLLGDGNVYGNIDINAGDEINVADGTTYLDGVINPEFVPVGGVVEATLDTGLFGEGALNIGAGGNLILAGPNSDVFDDEGPSYAFVETFDMDADGTITFELAPITGGTQPVGTYAQIFTDVANLDGTLVADVTPAGGLFADDYFWNNVIDAVTRNDEFDACVLAGAYADSPLVTGAFDGDICQYDGAGNVDLGIVRVAFDEVAGLDGNRLGVAGGLECLYEDADLTALAGTGLGEAIAELFLFDGEAYPQALNQLSGAGYAGYLQSFNSLGYHYNQILARATDCEIPALAGSALACRVAPMHLWGQLDYDTLSQDGDTELGDYDADRWSFLIGGDVSITPAAVVGVSVGKVTNKVDYDNLQGRVKGDGWQFGAYGTYDPGQFYVKALGTYTKMDGDGRRGIDFTPFGGTIAGEIDSDVDVTMWTFGLHSGFRISMGPNSVITPFLNYDYTNAKLKGFSETGDTGVELTVNGGRAKHSWLTGGVKWAGQMGGLVPEASIGYRHMFGNRSAGFSANFAGFEEDCDFDILSMSEKRGAVLAGLSVGGLLGMVDVRVGYNGAYNSDMREHSGFVKLVVPLGSVAVPPPPPPVIAPPPPPAPETQTCPDGSVILATDVCPAPPPPPPPPAPAPERG